MTKKNIIILVAALVLATLLGWFTKKIIGSQGKSDTELFSFAIEDTASVDRIIISDPKGMKMDLRRVNDRWVDANGDCVVQENIALVMEVFKNIEFKGYVPENSRKQYINLTSAMNTKVEIYQNGDWSKTWYIGPPTQDHYGQVMLLDSDEGGKSDLPVLMKIKGFHGFIEPRFFADPRKWQCTQIMAFTIDEIKKIDFKNLEDSEKSFSIDHEGFTFDVKQNGRKLPKVDTSKVFRYLQNYKKVNYEMPNFVLSDKQVDSVKNSKPFATLKVVSTKKKPIFLKFYRISGEPIYESEMASFVNYDTNRCWCLLPNGQLVKCQYFVFDPIFRGDIYFDFDKSKYKNITALGYGK